MDILQVTNLSKHYGSKAAVDDISFTVKKGEIFGILGPNGAGKTTALETIETLRPIEKGTIILDGIDVAKEPERVKQRIGVQLQSTSFFDRLTLTELIRLFASFYGTTVDTHKLLTDVQLEDKHSSYVDQLSGGQRQRFSIAAALVNNPVVLFLDEPTTGLDPQARHNLWELITEINTKRGVTIILTTHYMDEAQLLCNRLAIMDTGRIVALDTPSTLIKGLLATGFKKEVSIEQANLEDVFLNLTGKQLRE
jgi:ABC-2 type transport system ATP-binding protein